MSVWHKIWRVGKPVLEVGAAVVLVLALTLIPMLSGTNAAVIPTLEGVAVASTSASTNGPLSGAQSAFVNEVGCMSKLSADPANNMVNYWPSIGAAEHVDNIKTGSYPCGTWTGDFNGSNQVYQYKSDTTYSQILFITFKGPNDAYLMGGSAGPPSPGQYVSKFDPSTGREIWRTTLTNVNLSGQWMAAGSMAIYKDGSILAAAGPNLWRLDSDTGRILASGTVPIDPSVQPATGANLDGLTLAPDERGTILMKTQTRPNGCPTQGNQAMSACQQQYGPQPNTTVVAVDPVTLTTLATLTLDQSVTARPITTAYDGTIYMYMNAAKTLLRVVWDPASSTLRTDPSWQPAVIQDGQTGGTAPGVLGKWIVWNTNANPSQTAPQCAGTVSQADPTDIHRVCPWGNTMPAGATTSETPALPGVDPVTSQVYFQDWFLGGVHAYRVDQNTGDLTDVWSRDDWITSDYFTMVGPADQRVLVSQNLEPNFKKGLAGSTYRESVLWVNSANGATVAESAHNSATAWGSLINLGYGGRWYSMGLNGTIYIYQVSACSAMIPGAQPAVPQPTTNCASQTSGGGG
ncbi:hypothetical protein ACL02T_11930 [Pseudonocardia sp. RS010]|uniref:hypothetical protein n=1 Tax=Pseudonocardia sp. RS010 TaxID=3385979 RepID=UPI0039A3D11F